MSACPHLDTGCTPENARYIAQQLDAALEVLDAVANARRGPVAQARPALARAQAGHLDLCDVLALTAALGALRTAVGLAGDRLDLVEESLHEVVGAERADNVYQMVPPEPDAERQGRMMAALLACVQELPAAEAKARVERFLRPGGEE